VIIKNEIPDNKSDDEPKNKPAVTSKQAVSAKKP